MQIEEREERVDVKTISLPFEVWQEIDEVKDGWDGNRSRAILRIYKEWKEFKAEQNELLAMLRQNLKAQTSIVPELNTAA